MSGTIIGDVETLLSTSKAPYVVVLEAIVGQAVPAILAALAGQETAVEIAAPFIGKCLDFGAQAIRDLVAGKGAAAVLADLDSYCADVIEGIRFGGPTP